ncbi:hypothetical protein D779_2798 [Imhoffiella purpurea]|uniref:Uncharacterized protein n=1 Tax=Imhoffiella purpurea TaxID=1249627 RepID=W9V4A7_9GAMM|nr:hypothetical protein D779_2798 [Imhoffiella purpurea]
MLLANPLTQVSGGRMTRDTRSKNHDTCHKDTPPFIMGLGFG